MNLYLNHQILDITHVSSLPSTGVRVIQGFKCLLEEIFSQQTSDMTTSADVPDAMDSPSTTTSTLVGGVNVKGPLKVQEYYQLLGKKKRILHMD